MKTILLPALLLLVAPGAAGTEARPLGRAAGAIRVDGRLDDPGWAGAWAIDTFYEIEPGENVTPKVATVALVTYDEVYASRAARGPSTATASRRRRWWRCGPCRRRAAASSRCALSLPASASRARP